MFTKEEILRCAGQRLAAAPPLCQRSPSFPPPPPAVTFSLFDVDDSGALDEDEFIQLAHVVNGKVRGPLCPSGTREPLAGDWNAASRGACVCARRTRFSPVTFRARWKSLIQTTTARLTSTSFAS